jgi:hypothetical protein
MQILIITSLLSCLILGSLIMLLPIFILSSFLAYNKNLIINYHIEIKILSGIVFIGCLSSILNFNDFYALNFFIRDFFYYIQPVIYIWFGCLIAIYLKPNDVFFLQVIVFLILGQTLISLTPLVLNPNLILTQSYTSEERIGSSLSVIAFAVLYLYKKSGCNLVKDKIIYRGCVLILLFSTLVAFSRGAIINLFLVFSIPLLVKYKLNRYAFFTAVIFILFILFGGGLLNVGNVNMDDKSFFNKFLQSIPEITVRHLPDSSSISQNWRAYESYLGLEHFYRGSLLEYFIGQGLGVMTYTPTFVFEGANQLDILPIFHNAYINILLKTGFIGLFLYFVFVWKLCSVKFKGDSTEGVFYNYMIVFTGFFLLYGTLVTHGIYKTNLSAFMLILLGFSLVKYKKLASK